MAFTDLTLVNVKVSVDGTTWVAVGGTIAWDRGTETDGGDTINYMGGGSLVTQGSLTRTVTLDGLFDIADAGQVILRDALEARSTIWVGLIHAATDTARYGQAKINSDSDNVDVDGGDAHRFSMEAAFQGALTTGALPTA